MQYQWEWPFIMRPIWRRRHEAVKPVHKEVESPQQCEQHRWEELWRRVESLANPLLHIASSEPIPHPLGLGHQGLGLQCVIVDGDTRIKLAIPCPQPFAIIEIGNRGLFGKSCEIPYDLLGYYLKHNPTAEFIPVPAQPTFVGTPDPAQCFTYTVNIPI